MYKKLIRFFCMPKGYDQKFLLIMKLTSVMIIITLMQARAATYAQKVNYINKHASLEQIFKEIRKQTGYNILVSFDVLSTSPEQEVNFNQTPLKKVLEQSLQKTTLTYEIDNKDILIKEKTVSMDKIKIIQAPPYIIKGRVLDELGQPLARATVMLKGNKAITVTDQQGMFSLTVNIENKALNHLKLQVTYIGYEPAEIIVDEKLDIQTIKLKPGSYKLDQVQIVAYGNTTQRYNVGSVSQVTAKDIEAQPVSNPLAALEGRVPGLVVTQSSGLPGSSFQLQVRGQNSLNVNPGSVVPPDNPLIIIDGVPIGAQNGNINLLSSIASPGMYTTNPLGGMSLLNSLNPADIETIEVLRDADASSIYGSRGANGVILITTKRGKAGKTQVSGTFWTGDQKTTRTMPMMNTTQYLTMRRQAIANDGATPQVSQPYSDGYAPDLLTFDTSKNTDWKNYLFGRTAHTVDANVSVSAGSDNTQFLIGTSFHRENYVIPGDFSDSRIGFNVNLHHTSENKRLTIDFSTNFGYDRNNSSGDAFAVNSAFVLPPDFPELLNPDGSLKWSYQGLAYGNFKGNPLSYTKENYNMQTSNLVSHLQFEYEIAKDLALRASFGYNSTDVNETSLDPVVAQDPTYFHPTASANYGTNNFKTWIIEPQAEYKRTISKGKLDVLVGGSFQQNTNNTITINASDIANDALIGSLAAAGSVITNNNYSLYKYNAVFGRINYIWNNEFILNLTGRRDGSSRFGPGRQFGNFSSVGGGWIFSENRFVKHKLAVISYGKLHASYGTTGNDAVGDYQYTANWTSINGSTYQGSTGYVPQNLYNPDYSWAVNKKLEGGITLGLLKERILVDATYFRNRSGNQLVSYNLPIQTGFSSVTQNFPAVIQNTGLELQIDTKNITSGKFSWTSSFNLTVPKNKLVSFPGIENSSYDSYYVVGRSTSIIQGYQYAGVNPTTGVYQFLNAKGVLTSSPTYGVTSLGGDYQIIGDLSPRFYGGLRNTFKYNGFQLDFFFQYTKQMGYNYLGQIYKSGGPAGGIGNLPAAFLSSWQKPGDISSIESLTQNYSSASYGTSYDFGNSSGALGDASYIRLKTASFSYTISPEYLKKINISACRIYVNGQNLLTITKYKGNDPENQNIYGLPPLKTVVFGLQFTF